MKNRILNSWWEIRRYHYNHGLVIANFVSFILYMIIILLTKSSNDFIQIPIIHFASIALALLIYIAIANFFYYLGSISEIILKPNKLHEYRINCFKLGYWLSIVVPFIIVSVLSIIINYRSLGIKLPNIDIYWKDGMYMLTAVDRRSQMNLRYYDTSNNSIGLIEPTIFSIGSNEHYIVLKQHNLISNYPYKYDHPRINYYVIKKTNIYNYELQKEYISTPLTKLEFEQLNKQLQLPNFTKTFEDLMK